MALTWKGPLTQTGSLPKLVGPHFLSPSLWDSWSRPQLNEPLAQALVCGGPRVLGPVTQILLSETLTALLPDL